MPNLDAANPFTPDFGQTPPEMTGRGRLLARLRAALTAGPRRPEFTSLLLGPRGTGKTVALVAFTEIAQSDGWTVIKADALLDPDPGETLDATILRRCAEAADRDDPPPRRRFTGAHAGAAGVSAGVSWEAADRPALGLDRAVPRLLDLVDDKGGAGVLIVADDFHNATAKGISRLASLLQQVTKIEHRPLAFLGAGLPHVAHTKLTLKGFTFFQSIHRQRIPDMTADDSVRALASPLRDGEVACSSEAARAAAAITQGLPFAIQSMGSHLWDLAGGAGGEVEASDVAAAGRLMEDDVARSIVAPVWARLSRGDKQFLSAMAGDDGTSRPADIARRLGSAAGSAAVYKRRLLEEGAVLETGYGELVFASAPLRVRAVEQRREDQAVAAALARQRQLLSERGVAAEAGPAADAPAASADPAGPAAGEPAAICGKAMPRAGVACVLRAGHRGACRSKR